MVYRRISITIMVVALVAALLTSLMPLTLAAPRERAAKQDVTSTEDGSRGKERTGANERSRGEQDSSAKERTTSRQVSADEERTGAKERSGDKQASSNEEVVRGEEALSSQEVTTEEEVASGNERSGGGDTYIIVLNQEPTGGRGRDNGRGAAVREAVRELDQAHGLGVTHVYDAALAGFAAEIPNEAALRQLKRDPRVKSVEPDRRLHFTAQTLPTGVDRIGGDVERENTAPTAAGRPVAVIDSGIDATHPDLKGVVQGGYDCTTTQETWGHDGYGHGTAVGGIIAALNNEIGVVGVAPGTPLYDVRIGNDAGTMFMSWTLCGIDWVTKNAAAYNITVANMSFAGAAVTADHNACGPTTSALHNAICGLVAAGVTAVAAAGNDSKDANTAVPATYNEVTTVSALVDTDGCTGGKGTSLNVGRDDTRASFSNFGRDVDVAAPGVRILSTVPVAQGEYKLRSGTSHATPHVTAAYALGWAGSEETRKGVAEGILKLSANIGC